ncbi:MAG: PEP-CTERM sorting domain-containing protein [Sphingomonadales bacterium]|nr:PEP-CTERM sorting domain-containing protein [Sphingomonadales bacterium]
MRTAFAIVLGCLACASPALAQAGAQVPEPTDGTLLALGLAGVMIGRIVARKRRGDDEQS